MDSKEKITCQYNFIQSRFQFQDVLDILFAGVIPLTGNLNFTFDTELNHAASEGTRGDYTREWIDYVMFRYVHL